MANIKVSDRTRDQLAAIAKESPRGKMTMDQAIQALIAEYRRTQADRLRALTPDEGLMARIEAARTEPLDKGYTTERVLDMLAERRRDDAAA